MSSSNLTEKVTPYNCKAEDNVLRAKRCINFMKRSTRVDDIKTFNVYQQGFIENNHAYHRKTGDAFPQNLMDTYHCLLYIKSKL